MADEAINRQRTRALVVVHSHISGTVNCSNDVIAVQTQKSIKGAGTFSFTLVPRKNYENILYPNDIVNIYMDPGDGVRGFVRVMMGYVDRCSPTIETNEQGSTTTAYTVVGTDLTKVIDKTVIYFNPHLAGRAELFDPRFGNSQLGGHALRTRGIQAHGTPAQMVENLLQLLIGFGEQWVLPSSYPTNNFLDKSRSLRRQRAKAQLPKQVQDNLAAAFGTQIDGIGLDQNIEQEILAKLADLNQNLTFTDDDQKIDEYRQKYAVLNDLLTSRELLTVYQTTARETQNGTPVSIIDVLSLDFMEALTVDGYIVSNTVWNSEGPLASILYSWSNEIVNELCFDLRPVAVGGSDQCFGTRYSTAPDELGYNVNPPGFDNNVSAVQYVPACIMREYPYSTVEGLDLSQYSVLGSSAGFMPFGPVFAMERNVKGRKIYNYQNAGVDSLLPEPCLYRQGPPLKHLDVETIYTSDVQGTGSLGRSDNDIYNLFEIYPNAPNQQDWKFILRDIMPILNPISIARNGLRVRTLNTRYANYSRDQLCEASGSSGVDTATIRRNLMRWALLIEQWYQHNVEYRSGSITTRFRPEIRAGYRLDWVDRNESFYVESVSHNWKYPNAATTTMELSRGQPNNPFPAYIPPVIAGTQRSINQPVTATTTVLTRREQDQLSRNQGTADRGATGRLSKFFLVQDYDATRRAVGGEAKSPQTNTIDEPGNINGAVEYPNRAANKTTSAAEQIDANAIPIDGNTA